MWVSWAGKNTILRLLTDRNADFHQVISYKSRPLRPGETDGVDYHYLSDEKFQEAIEQGTFLEYAKVHNISYYGTKKSDIIDWLAAGKILFKEIDMEGIVHIAETNPEIYNSSLRIFLDLSQEVMIKRITGRAPITDVELQKRLASAIREKELAQQYASHIIPAEGTVEEVYEAVSSIIQQYINENRKNA